MNVKQNIFILTGAGISKESGIETFREKDGLWDNHKIEDVCTPEGFYRNPENVHNFYNERRKKLNHHSIRPNQAHLSLAELEKKWKGEFLIVTQNIDNLHEKAGSKKVLHIHGTIDKFYCMGCNKFGVLDFNINSSYVCTNCGKSGKCRVDVVWFGEQPKYLDRVYSFLEKTELFISIGTSNNVYPAAGFIDFLIQVNPEAEFLEFNLEKTNKSNLFNNSQIGNASETVKEFVNQFVS